MLTKVLTLQELQMAFRSSQRTGAIKAWEDDD